MVHGAGELRTLNDTVNDTRVDGRAMPYPEFVPALDAGACAGSAARYLDTLRKIAPEGERVTDKMPSNYYFVGLIHLAMPNAKIIHTVRDPVDTCISCFSKLFTAEQNHTYDLGELGRYYRRYERLMAHWRRVLPAGRILDVRYEDVVADIEGAARRILAHCGLPWDERCLVFSPDRSAGEDRERHARCASRSIQRGRPLARLRRISRAAARGAGPADLAAAQPRIVPAAIPASAAAMFLPSSILQRCTSMRPPCAQTVRLPPSTFITWPGLKPLTMPKVRTRIFFASKR